MFSSGNLFWLIFALRALFPFSFPRSGRATYRSLHQSVLFLRYYGVSQGLFQEPQLDLAFPTKGHLISASSSFSELTSPATKGFLERMLVVTFLEEEQRRGGGVLEAEVAPRDPPFPPESVEMKRSCQAYPPVSVSPHVEWVFYTMLISLEILCGPEEAIGIYASPLPRIEMKELCPMAGFPLSLPRKTNTSPRNGDTGSNQTRVSSSASAVS